MVAILYSLFNLIFTTMQQDNYYQLEETDA